MEFRNYRLDFPLFAEEDKKEKPLAYLDSGATSQKPLSVIEAEADYYRNSNANPHRGAYELSMEATRIFDETRENIKRFLNVSNDGEIVFTKSATESLNLIAYSYGLTNIQEDDEILIFISEHHSNLVSWQMVAERKKAKLIYLYCDDRGQVSTSDIRNKISDKTKILAIGHVSNVTGAIQPIKEIISIAKENDVVTVIDGTQAVPHLKVDLSELDPDFYVGSGHKMMAPMGVGFLYGRKSLLDEMPPFLYGGDMIEYVTEQESTFAPVPQKFEAGTQNVGAVAGLKAAIEYLEGIGMENVFEHEKRLTEYMLKRINELPYIRILGDREADDRVGVVAFVMDDVHPHDIATILDQEGIAVRSGHHCAQPLHRFFGQGASARASLYIYNNEAEIDRLIEGLKKTRRLMGYES